MDVAFLRFRIEKLLAEAEARLSTVCTDGIGGRIRISISIRSFFSSETGQWLRVLPDRVAAKRPEMMSSIVLPEEVIDGSIHSHDFVVIFEFEVVMEAGQMLELIGKISYSRDIRRRQLKAGSIYQRAPERIIC